MAPAITLRMTATISLASMDIPLFGWLVADACALPAATLAGLCGTVIGDFKRVAMGRNHIQLGAGTDRRLAFHQRVPGSTAVAHARAPRALVHPVLEARRLPGIHLRHLPRGILRAV